MNIKAKKMNLGGKKMMTLYLTKLGRDKIDKLYGLNSYAYFTLDLVLCLQKLLNTFYRFHKSNNFLFEILEFLFGLIKP